MKQLKNIRSSTNIVATVALSVLLAITLIMHLLILLRGIPFNSIWGGKLKDTSQMYLFETVSVIINLVMMGVVLLDAGFIKLKMSTIIIRIALRIMFVLFLLNTAGNFNSENQFEKNILTPMTLLLSLLCLILIFKKKQKNKYTME